MAIGNSHIRLVGIQISSTFSFHVLLPILLSVLLAVIKSSIGTQGEVG